MSRYAMFDRFGYCPPGFVPVPEDRDYVLPVLIQMKVGGRVEKHVWLMLTSTGRNRYERDMGGPPEGGWKVSPDILEQP